MKKGIKIILVLIFLGTISYILWPRSLKKMETIARQELQGNLHFSRVHELKGPLIYEQQEYVEFIWHKKLEWGDSSKIFIRVYRDLFSCERYDSWWRNFFCYLKPQVTMNYQWYYFLFADGGTSNFKEVFPTGLKGIKVMSSIVEMQHDKKGNGFEFTVPAERVIFFLKKGYFEVLEQKGETTVIAFYEPVINIYRQNKRDTIPLFTTKVFENDTTGIKIVPYDYYNVLGEANRTN